MLDVSLPRLNGIEVAKSVGELNPAEKIMFLSQESSPNVVQEVLTLGDQSFVHQPRAQSDLLFANEAVPKGRTFVSSDLGFRERTDVRALHRHEIFFCSQDQAL